MSRVVGTRLMTAYQNMCWGFSLNCDFFSRYLAGVSFDPANVTIDKFGSMSKVETIPVGGIGLVNVPDEGVVHSIGYGLGEEGLQALSGQGIVGIADNKAVLNFYSEFYGGDAELYELQLHNGHWSI
ncbi:MAG TPA: hypothetical protein VLG47_05535 [Candidatus Saccharimonadales bacterium]|nr:hypothetical protein [Candidatus Saccharimonadales bacterium]